MDKEILKLFPQKAFKLLSIKDTLRIGTQVTKSIIDKESYELQFGERSKVWRWTDIKMSKKHQGPNKPITSKEDGEKVLRIYFSQFFQNNLAVHLDLRASAFSTNENFTWVPSKLHYNFSKTFMEGVRSLYRGFYLEDAAEFELGLKFLGMIKDSMNEQKKNAIIEIFTNHFGEGRTELVHFSLDKLQDSFNIIFAFFLKEDIPLNPEFAVLGVNLVTLYSALQTVPYALNVREVFMQVIS